jgi:hypothetical protein
MRYPLFGTGLSGNSLNATAQHRINLYLEQRPEQDKTPMLARGTPGKDLVTSFGDTPIRGFKGIGDLLYVVHRGTFYSVNNASVVTVLGSLLTTTGRVSIQDNGNIIQLLDGLYGYTYDISTATFAQVTDPDFVPGFINTWLTGYFIKDRRGSTNKREWGRFDISTDGSTYDVLDFANAESSPDYLQAPYVDSGQLILFGENTTEFWSNTGDPDFPLSYQGSATIEWGLAAKYSVAKFRDSVIFLARNRMGEVQVIVLNGYTPQIVSGVDLGYLINRYASVENATAFSYMLNEHPMYQINFPTANKSWLFDGSTGAWSELQSEGGRDRGEIGGLYINNYLITDFENGNIYRLNGDSYTSNGTPIVRSITTRHISGEEYIGVGRIILDIEPGVGLISGQGSDPQVILEVSKDGGHTWGQQLWRKFGKIGEYGARAVWNRIGSSRDHVYRFTISDPVKVVILGAYLDVEK